MVDLTVLVKSVLEDHKETEDGCLTCKTGGDYSVREWPCAPYRIASDWQRQHQDLCRAWKNRTGKEVFLVRKFACTICSEKDTGLICVECISAAKHDDDLDHKEEMIGMEMARDEALEDMANG